MFLAISIMNHPGIMLKGLNSKLPGFWRTLRNFRQGKASCTPVDEDAMELVAKRNKTELEVNKYFSEVGASKHFLDQ